MEREREREREMERKLVIEWLLKYLSIWLRK